MEKKEEKRIKVPAPDELRGRKREAWCWKKTEDWSSLYPLSHT